MDISIRDGLQEKQPDRAKKNLVYRFETRGFFDIVPMLYR